jgi:hypothetical protein
VDPNKVYIPEHYYNGRRITATNKSTLAKDKNNQARIERLWGALDSPQFSDIYYPISSWGTKYQRLMMANTLNHSNIYDLYRYLIFNMMPPNLAIGIVFASDAKKFGNYYRLYPSNQYTQAQVTKSVLNMVNITLEGTLFTTETDMYDNMTRKIVRVKPSRTDRLRGGLGYYYVWQRPPVYEFNVPAIPDLDIDAHKVYTIAGNNMRPKYPSQQLAIYTELQIPIPRAKLIDQTHWNALPTNLKQKLTNEFAEENKNYSNFGILYNSRGEIVEE